MEKRKEEMQNPCGDLSLLNGLFHSPQTLYTHAVQYTHAIILISTAGQHGGGAPLYRSGVWVTESSR